MGWFIKFIDSSIGKKIVMALTGLFLSIFLIAHLAGNLLLLAGDGGVKFEEYANFMAESGNIPVRIVEIALFILLIYHIINGIRITSINRKARNIKYKNVDASANSTFFSRFMIQSGGIIFIFLVIHLRSFFFPYRFSHPEITMYEAVKTAFENPLYSGFYVFAMVLLAFHLNHGVQSAFQTLGLYDKKITPIIKKTGTAFAIIICLAFAIIPLYFLMGMGE